MNEDQGDVFQGTKFRFKKGKCIGSGGNGSVYKIEIIDNINGISYPVVAKFFEYTQDKDERVVKERYERFRREIKAVKELQELKIHVIPILDYKCPENCPISPEEAWYIMPLAKNFSVKYKGALIDKLREMQELALIIKNIHDKGYSHRDIKPENILIWKGHIYLTDFGLVWKSDQKRITGKEERVGPWMILPPELEEAGISKSDFKSADVYLFAKVLWMAVKEDTFGFRGQYNRRDPKIYINSEQFEVKTLEPIHKMLEEATQNSPEDRLKIDDCIELIETQIKIIEGDIDEETLKNFKFDETEKFFINNYEPQQYVFEQMTKIYPLLSDLVPVSEIYIYPIVINGKRNGEKLESLKTTFQAHEEYCSLIMWSNGKKIREYIFSIKSLIIKNTDKTKKSEIIVQLNSLDYLKSLDGEHTIYKAYNNNLGIMSSQIIVSEDYYLILCKN